MKEEKRKMSIITTVNRDKGTHNLIKYTTSWIYDLVTNRLPENCITEIFVFCSKSEHKRLKKILSILEDIGIRTVIISESSKKIDTSESLNSLMDFTSNDWILHLNPSILYSSITRGFIERVINKTLLKKEDEILSTINLKIAMIDLKKTFSSLHMLYTARTLSIIDTKTTFNTVPLIFNKTKMKWIDYVPKQFKDLSSFPTKIQKEFTNNNTSLINIERQKLVLHNEQEIPKHKNFASSLSLDFSRVASPYFYLEDYLSSMSKIVPYHVIYNTHGIVEIKIGDINLGKIRYPNPYEIRPIIKTLFMGSDAFMHYLNYRLSSYKSQDYYHILQESNRIPKIYSYGMKDEGLFVFPFKGENSIFTEIKTNNITNEEEIILDD